jgi:hypothetical protein
MKGKLSTADQAVWSAAEASLPWLSALQRAALAIYGRLEPDRALVWTMEELGELAQAVLNTFARGNSTWARSGRHWGEILRLIVTIYTSTVSASDLVRALQRGGHGA